MRRLFLSSIFLIGTASLMAQVPARVLPEEIGARPQRQQYQSQEHDIMATGLPKGDVGVQKLIPRIPVIMVQFSDFTFTRTKEQVDSMYNAIDFNEVYPHANAVGSIRQYFYDQSMGQYNPQFDIYGPVTVSESCCAAFSNFSNVRELTKEACQLADDEIDFTQYDADQDGKIDLVYIYYAGFGRNDASYIPTGLVSDPEQLIWPHWSKTSGATFDGKQICDYECANELDGYWTKSMDNAYPAGIGIAVHEFCHSLGLPDLYPTNGTSTEFKHLGAYDIMDYGPYNDEMFCPPSLSAYERWFLGWLTPTLLNEDQNVSLDYIGTSNQAYLVTTDGQSLDNAHGTTQPYYLLENRQKQKWDNGTVFGYDLLGHGMMITRVEFDESIWRSNVVNNDSTHQRVQLISADGDFSLKRKSNWYGKKGDLFPAGATEYNGIDGYSITNIEEHEGGMITFRFLVNGEEDLNNPLVPMQQGCRKVFRDNQLLIERGGRYYSLTGQEVK